MLKKFTLQNLKLKSKFLKPSTKCFASFEKFYYEDALNVKSLFTEEETMVIKHIKHI